MASTGAEGKQAWVTLATNDSYAIGALVLAHSLIGVQTRFPLAVLVSEQVSQTMRNRLAEVFSEVHNVNILDSNDSAHLALLARPELGVTFTKLHCWALTHLDKAVFLDADTLVMRNCDELFEREEFSAAPDAGWPDCFNSGVFVYRPSLETYNDLLQFAVTHGSFDGGDQGLLNAYFSDWATKDISKHLPFAYNMTATAVYSYLPAHKRYGTDVRIAHLIGYPKPWQVADLAAYTSGAAAPSEYIQCWWNLFLGKVKPALSSDMDGTQLATCPAMVQAAPSPPPPSEVLVEAVAEADSGASFEPISPTIEQTPPPAPPPPTQELRVVHVYNEQSPWYGDYRQTGIPISYPQPEPKLPTPPPSPVPRQYTEITFAAAAAAASEQVEFSVALETTPTFNELLNAEAQSGPYPASPQLEPENLLLTSTSPVLEQTTNMQAESRETDSGIAAMMEKLELKPEEASPLLTEDQNLEEERRRHREAWERGEIDYAGRDSFENIMARMKDTMNRVNSKPVV